MRKNTLPLTPNQNIVSVAIDVSSSVMLFKFNKEEPLGHTIKSLCEECAINFNNDKFSLQFIHDLSDKQLSCRYVTEENKNHIVDGSELKLVLSPQEMTSMICENLNESKNGDLCWALERIAGSVNGADPVLVSLIFENCYETIIRLTNNSKLPPKLYNCCLKAILGFLKSDYIEVLNGELIEALIKNINSSAPVESSVVENSLRLLEMGVCKKQYTSIAISIDFDDLIIHLWDKDSPAKQECTLALINSIAHYCPCEDRKRQLLTTMDSETFRLTISLSVLSPGPDPTTELSQQLYIYQTLILDLLVDKLDPMLIDFNSLPDVSIISEDRRYSNFESSPRDSVFEANTESSESSRNSKELSDCQPFDRISSTWKNSGMHSKSDHLVLSFLNLELSQFSDTMKHLDKMPDIKTINQLTYNCIQYFSKNYRRNYQCSLVTQGCNNFIIISFDIVNLIVHEILRIGKSPEANSTNYSPLVFSSSVKQPFMEELFCVAMWLFERTKREMKANSYEDYQKVLKVMERQLTEGLMAQPKAYNELEVILRKSSYSSISDQWQIERQAKQQHFIGKSSAVAELIKKLNVEMIEIVKDHRISYITNGSYFPEWNSQRHQITKNTVWFARLSNNKKFILYSASISKEDKTLKEMKSVCLKDVVELVVGKKCPHLKDFKWRTEKQDNPLGFSLLLDPYQQPKSLNFVAETREVYDFWLDGLNLLLGNKMKSTSHRQALNMLVDMELKIRLLDVEGIDCPYEAPPVPPLPENYDFKVK